MALETWLLKVKKPISSSFDSASATPPSTKKHAIIIKKSITLGVLAFETAGLMSKLIHLWQSLSVNNIIRLRNESISLQGVHRFVSTDESLLLSLACAEMIENLRLVANSLSRLSKKCHDSNLRNFDRLFIEFSNTGRRDPYNWVFSWKEMEAKIKNMDRYVTTTVSLYRQIEELSVLENGLKKSLQYKEHEQKIMGKQQKLLWQKQEVKYKKEKSLWIRSFDTVTILLARSVFTVLARNKLIFGVGQAGYSNSLPRSLSDSAAVYPSENHPADSFIMLLGPLMKSSKDQDLKGLSYGFFELNSKILNPPASTLGGAALALHYAILIIVMEKMIRTPQLVGFDARDDLYAMLPQSIRWSLRGRLKGVGFSASDPVLAGEWRDALGKIMGWLSPLAHNMIKWQSERSFEHQNMTPKTNVLLLQTLYFANQEKTEAALTELLVGLNYIWRFEREMNAKALFDCTNFNGSLNLQNSG